jgi:hypothetical protein
MTRDQLETAPGVVGTLDALPNDRRLVPFELVTAKKLVANDMMFIYRVDEHTVAKLGDEPRLAEAHAMRFVRKHTSVPVPEVYSAYFDESM